jgi:hypothetical protein
MESSYLYFSDESFCRPLYSLRLLIDRDLLVADVMVSTSTADVYMLTPVLWVPLDFFDDVVIRLRRLLRRLLGIGLPLLLVEPGERYCCC